MVGEYQTLNPESKASCPLSPNWLSDKGKGDLVFPFVRLQNWGTHAIGTPLMCFVAYAQEAHFFCLYQNLKLLIYNFSTFNIFLTSPES